MSGILLVDKSADWTSFDVISKLKRVYHTGRIGHSGTLDPMATGLLVVFIGRATRAVEYAESDSKRYIAGFRPGIVTDTQDTTGTVLAEKQVDITYERLEEVTKSFLGEYSQIPPMYSAIKVNGQRLYDIARKGGEVERKARNIFIHGLDIIGRNGNDYILDVRCSKGTYIRTLCHDIGQKLGCGGCMSALRRVEAGNFSVNDAHTIEEILDYAGRGEEEKLLLPLDGLFAQYDALTVDGPREKKLRCGNEISFPASDGKYRVYSCSGEFLALCNASQGILKIEKSFYEV